MQKVVATTAAAVISEITKKSTIQEIDSGGDDESDTSSVIADKEDEIHRRNEEVFFAFDQGDRTIDCADLGHIFRCMHLNVTQADLEEISAQLIKEENQSIKFEYLIPRLSAAFDDKKWRPKDEQTLELAFQSLESHAGAEMNKERLGSYLKLYGEPFSEAEFNEMISHMTVRRSGICDWECYVKDVIESITPNSI